VGIRRVNHIAILVESLEAAIAVYRDALGLSLSHTEDIPEQGVKVGCLPSGDTEIELLEPLSPDSGVGRYLAKRGEGLHHICLEVDDIAATMAELRDRGVALIDDSPKQGVHGKVAFLHPKSAHGVLIELLEPD
jgi:methylmalonyl-CoA/ethylmalonyl-CoA epimerase